MYISYGPPDEIEAHPSGGAYTRPAEQGGGTTYTYPFQKWRYRYIEGMGSNIIVEFVDKDKNGDYPLTTDPNEKDVTAISPGRPLDALQVVQGVPMDPNHGFGNKHAGVMIYPEGQVTLVIPLEGPRAVRHLRIVKTAGGQTVTSIADGNARGLNFIQKITLKPGSYVFTATRSGDTEVVTFAVK